MILEEVNLTLHLVKVHGEADLDDLNRLTHTLRRNLDDMDTESVTLLHGQDYLPGAKGDALTVGGLLVSVLPTALPAVLEFLREWVLRNNNHMIRAKVQRGDQLAEIEYPANMSHDELQKHLEMIKLMLA
jgi:hypothetical protein